MGFYNDNIKKFTKLRQDKKWTDCRQLAEKGWQTTGDYDCLHLLGVDYYRGLSTTTDYARAFQIFDEVVKKLPKTAVAKYTATPTCILACATTLPRVSNVTCKRQLTT